MYVNTPLPGQLRIFEHPLLMRINSPQSALHICLVSPPHLVFICLLQYIVGVYLTLNGDYIPNHGYVMISDIGSTDDTALICNTNRFGNLTSRPRGRLHSGGDWFAPDGTRVGDRRSDDVPGFDRDRYPMKVQLHRYTPTGTPSEGIYYCVVEDATFINQTVYVGLYNSGGGGMYIWIYIYIYIYIYGYTSNTITAQPSIQEVS